MVASGGTNSTPPLKKSLEWMNGEDAVHMSKNGKKPLKFVVLMTDGNNEDDGAAWQEEAGTGIWRRTRCYNYGDENGDNWHCWRQESKSKNKPDGDEGYTDGGKGYNFEWKEGRIAYPFDEQSLAECKALKDKGVKVYTIGFALEPGYYYDERSDGAKYVSSSTSERAYSFLRKCASSPATFIAAEDTDDLIAAFDTIGQQIVADVVRIKN